MVKSFKTEGVILKRKDFGEADRLLTVFTLHKGKVTVLAKGVRRITSRRSGNVELLNRAHVFLHPGKNFLILTEASTIETYQNIKDDLTLSTYGYHLVELIDKLIPENLPDSWIYDNFVHVLSLLNENPRQIFVRAFEAKLLDHLGFVNFKDIKGANLQNINSQTIELLEKTVALSWEKIIDLKINSNEAMELELILRYHIEKIIEGSLKSRQFLKKS